MSHPSTHHVYQPGEFLPGTVYVVRKKLGAGGMGVVYEVEDTSIGKIYVVKTVHLHHAGKAIYSSLTRNEARMLAKLRHRNIVEVITAGTTADANQLAYFVMEKLEGCTLGTLRGVALPMGYVSQIGRELLDALQYVHHPKDDRPVIVHRDIKPENIFLAKIEEDDGAGGDSAIRHRVKLLDFGIGAVVGVQQEGFWGTARYASPEQLDLAPVTPKTDLYAAAIVLFELLTGRHPFEGAKTAQEFMDAHRVQVPPRVSQFVHVPKAVDDCIDAALSKLPDQRPRDAHKMISALAELRHVERPLSQRHANTTIQDLNTVIERQTQAGYEAYASSGADTIDGMSRPPVEEGSAPEVAYSFGASRLAVARTERAAPAATPAAKGVTVPMAPPHREGFRQAPTRSLREPPAARRPGRDTEDLLHEEEPVDVEELLDGFNPAPAAQPSRRAPAQARKPAAPRGTRPIGGTSAPVENSIVLPMAGPSKRTAAKSLLVAIVGAGAIAAVVLVVRGSSGPSAAAGVTLAVASAPAATAVAAAPPLLASPVPAAQSVPLVAPVVTPVVASTRLVAAPSPTSPVAPSAAAPRGLAPRPAPAPGSAPRVAASSSPAASAAPASFVPPSAPSTEPKPAPRDDLMRTM